MDLEQLPLIAKATPFRSSSPSPAPKSALNPGRNTPAAFDPDALTRALRIAGAALVVASASTFMLQHWQGGNDLSRYAMLVGQSLLLAAAAYFVGLTVREGRSARTFLGLVLATIPISFAVLGGLVYSQFHVEPLSTLPHYASWIAPSKLSALLAVAGTLVVLVPLAVISFVALARKEAKALTLAFVASNLLVLIPMREPVVVAAIAGLGLLGFLHLEVARFSQAARLDTFEGKLARVMPFAPPLIMLGRVFHLYQARPPFLGALLLIAGACIWLLLAHTQSASRRDFGAWSAGLFGLVGWALCWSGLAPSLHSASVTVLLLGLPAAGWLLVAALRAAHGRDALSDCSIVLASVTVVMASALNLDTFAAVSCIVLGIGVAVWGAALRMRVHLVGGALVALFGLGAEVWLAMQADDIVRWASLTVVGVLLIVGSAYIERHRARVAVLWEKLAVRPVQGLDP